MIRQLVLAAAASAVVATAAAAQTPIVVKVGTSIAGDNHPLVITVGRWAQLVKQRSGGAIDSGDGACGSSI